MYIFSCLQSKTEIKIFERHDQLMLRSSWFNAAAEPI